MKVKRMVTKDVSSFKVGDIIKFKMTDGEKVEAMAMKREEDGMIFCMIDCLNQRYPMNTEQIRGSNYERSYLRTKMNSEVLDGFPLTIRELMVPFDNGDMVRIPTEREFFGKNKYGEYEGLSVKRWKPMKQSKNRISFNHPDEFKRFVWLQNCTRTAFTIFVCVGIDGDVCHGNELSTHGVRPVFKLRNMIEKEEEK